MTTTFGYSDKLMLRHQLSRSERSGIIISIQFIKFGSVKVEVVSSSQIWL